MTKCKALLENGLGCQMATMMVPDKSQPLVYFLDKNRKNVSTVGWPLKPADHGMCYYHHNQVRSGTAMEQKQAEKRKEMADMFKMATMFKM